MQQIDNAFEDLFAPRQKDSLQRQAAITLSPTHQMSDRSQRHAKRLIHQALQRVTAEKPHKGDAKASSKRSIATWRAQL